MFRNGGLMGLLLAYALLTCNTLAEERTWTSADGGFTVEAELIRVEGQTAYLRRSDNGKEIAVKISQLSAKDRRFARAQATKTPSTNQQAAAANEQGNVELAPKPSAIDGAPVLSNFLTTYADRIKPADHAKEVAKFLELIKLRAYPDTLSDLAAAYEKQGLAVKQKEMLFPAAQAEKLIELFVPQSASQAYLNRRANEFQRIRAFQQIVERYNGKLLEAAPKPPFEAVLLEAVPLGSYDRAAKAFPLEKVTGNGIKPPKLGNIQLHYSDQEYTLPDSLPMAADEAESLLNRLSDRNVILAAKVRFTDVWPDEMQRFRSHASVELVGLSVYPFKSLSDPIHRYEMEQPKPSVAENLPADIGSSQKNAALNKKMAGLANKYRLPTFKKMPILPFGVSRDSAQYQAVKSFLKLVALGMDPQQIDQLAPELIATYFPRNISTRYVATNQFRQLGWKGADELEQRAARKEFFEKHGEQLEQMAVKPPIRFLVVTKIGFTSYDFQRNGLALDGGGGLLRTMGNYFPYVLPPVRWQRFWQVEPAGVRKLENVRGRHFGYLLRAVDFHEPPLRHPYKPDEFPPLIGRLASAELYADENLSQRMTSWGFENFPASVLRTGLATQQDVSSKPIPLDEFSIAALMASDPSINLAEDAWKEIWREVHMRDQATYSAASGAINLESSAHMMLAKLNSEAARTSRGRGNPEEQRKTAEQNLELAVETLERLMRPDKRPFFPPNAPEQPRDASLSDEHRKLLQGWLRHRVEKAGKQFSILAQVGRNREGEPPTFQLPQSGAISTHLQKRGFQADRVLQMNGRMAVQDNYHPVNSVRAFDAERFHENLLRVGDSIQTNVYLAFPDRVHALIHLLPEDLLSEMLEDDASDYQRAVEIDVEVDHLEFLPVGQDRGTNELVMHVIPKRLKLLHLRETLFDLELEEDALKNMPERPLPKPETPKDNGKPLALSPMMLGPMVMKHEPEAVEGELLDQLMVMRWKLENQNLLGLERKPAQRLFRQQQMPTPEEREQFADRFEQWLADAAKTLPGRYTFRFKGNEFDFQHPHFRYRESLQDIPYPVNLSHSAPNRWLPAGARQSVFSILERTVQGGGFSRRARADVLAPEQRRAVIERYSISPRHVFLDPPFEIPDSDGKFSKQREYEKRSRRGIAGLPAVSSAEPVLLLLRLDKEIWPQQDARLAKATYPPELEIEFETVGIELRDQPPPHSWIETYNRFRPRQPVPGLGKLNEIEYADHGSYAVLHAQLTGARLVDPNSGKTVLPLVLKEYRAIDKEVPQKEAESQDRSMSRNMDLNQYGGAPFQKSHSREQSAIAPDKLESDGFVEHKARRLGVAGDTEKSGAQNTQDNGRSSGWILFLFGGSLAVIVCGMACTAILIIARRRKNSSPTANPQRG